jgi:hypothetical protein
MFHLVCALSAISPTPDITGPVVAVVGASPRIGKEHKCEFWAFIAFFFSREFLGWGLTMTLSGVGLLISRDIIAYRSP